MSLVVGAIHGEILPRVMFSPPGSQVSTPPGLPGRLAQTVLARHRAPVPRPAAGNAASP